MATTATVASGSVGAADSWVGPIAALHGRFDVGISGTFTATVTVQRRPYGFAGGWRDIETFTDGVERTGYSAGAWEVRAGCKAAEYTSGTVAIDLRA